MDDGELRELAGSWELALDARRASPATMRGYTLAVRQMLDWLQASGRVPDLADADTVRGWLAANRGAWKGTTAQLKLAAVRSFAQFLAAEEGLDVSGTLKVEWPKSGEYIPPALSDGDVEAMIGACNPRTFPGVRDAAIISLLYDTLMRSDELLAMRRKTADHPGDVDLRRRTVHMIGKGSKERYAAFSPGTAVHLDRYLRHRGRQPGADLPWLWLAMGRGRLSSKGLYFLVRRRGEQAGVRAHPHMARAGGATKWRMRGGSTEGLMTIGGWRSVRMVQLYTRAAESELAIAEAKRLHDQG